MKVGSGVGVSGVKTTATSVALVGTGDGAIAITAVGVVRVAPLPSPSAPKKRSLPSVTSATLAATMPISFSPHRLCFRFLAVRRVDTSGAAVAWWRFRIRRRSLRDNRRGWGASGGGGESCLQPMSRLGGGGVSICALACLRRGISA